MTILRTFEMLADALAAKSRLCRPLANLRRHLDGKVHLERVVDFRDLRHFGLCGGCGSRWSFWWLSAREG